MRRAAQYLAGRLGDVVHARSDAAHRARGWEVRRGEWGGRRYRLDVASWLDAQIYRAGDPLMPDPTGMSGMPGTPGGSDVLVRWGRFGDLSPRRAGGRINGREVA